jgi:hypothetical protein
MGSTARHAGRNTSLVEPEPLEAWWQRWSLKRRLGNPVVGVVAGNTRLDAGDRLIIEVEYRRLVVTIWRLRATIRSRFPDARAGELSPRATPAG